jgi:hypothetical protein
MGLQDPKNLAERCSAWTDRSVRPHIGKGRVKGGGQECPPYIVNIPLGMRLWNPTLSQSAREMRHRRWTYLHIPDSHTIKILT